MVGYLTREDVRKLARGEAGAGLTVGELAVKPRAIAHADEPISVAADILAETDTESLPVVDPVDDSKVVGIFSRDDAFRARVIWFKEENLRERHLSVASWLQGLRKNDEEKEA